MEIAKAAPRHLALYHFDYCPFCVDVRRVLARLSIEVELRNINQRPEFLAELVQAQGRRTVPVLRIEEAGKVRWLPESLEIIDYLRSLPRTREPSEPPPADFWTSRQAVQWVRWAPIALSLSTLFVPWLGLRIGLLALAAALLVRRYWAPKPRSSAPVGG